MNTRRRNAHHGEVQNELVIVIAIALVLLIGFIWGLRTGTVRKVRLCKRPSENAHFINDRNTIV